MNLIELAAMEDVEYFLDYTRAIYKGYPEKILVEIYEELQTMMQAKKKFSNVNIDTWKSNSLKNFYCVTFETPGGGRASLLLGPAPDDIGANI